MVPDFIDQINAGATPQPEVAVALSVKSPGPHCSLGATDLPPPSASGENGPKRPCRQATPDSRSTNPAVLDVPGWFSTALLHRWQTYREALKRCRKEVSVEEVHELRVAARRLIAQFVLLDRLVPGGKSAKAQRLLRCQLKSLGPLRDIHVQRMAIEQQADRFPVLSELWRQLEKREPRAAKAAAREVREFRTGKLEKWITQLVAELNEQARSSRKRQKLEAAALRCATDAFEEAVRRRRLIDFSDLETVHRTRVAFKKFRYIVESLPPEMTGMGKRQLRALALYQRKMGNVQDVHVLSACLSEFLERNGDAWCRLKPFSAYLRRRRARALRTFRQSADSLFGFWPPPAVVARQNARTPAGSVS